VQLNFPTFWWVVNHIVEQLSIFEGRVNIWIHRAGEDLYVLIRDWIVGAYSTFEAIRQYIAGQLNIFEGRVNIWIHRAGEDLYILVRDWVGKNFATLDDLTGGDLGKLVKGLIPLLDSILLFFRDPIRFLRDLLLPLLVSWVCSALAHEIDSSIPLIGALHVSGAGGLPGETGGVSPSQSGELAWPLNWLTISGNTFGWPPGHMGLDLALPAGRQVYAMHDGIATVPPFMVGAYGNYVTVSGSPWWTLYAHAERILVPSGERVKKGQQIMVGNSTGNSTGDHLHLEIKYNGQYIDPVTVLPVPPKA
jgi:hypothetical protein